MKSLGSGTLGYIAPEMINQEEYGYYSDFFAVGVVAFLFMRMQFPYPFNGRERHEI